MLCFCVVLSTFASFLLSPTCVRAAQRGLRITSRRHLNLPAKTIQDRVLKIISNFSSHLFGDDKKPKLWPHSTTLRRNNRCKVKSAGRVEMCSIEIRRRNRKRKNLIRHQLRVAQESFNGFVFKHVSLCDDVRWCHIENLIRNSQKGSFVLISKQNFHDASFKLCLLSVTFGV